MEPVDQSSRVSIGKTEKTEGSPDAAAVAEAQQTEHLKRLFSETSSADAAASQPARKKMRKKKAKAKTKPRSASSTKKPVKGERRAGMRREPISASAARMVPASQTVEILFSGNTTEFETKHVKKVNRVVMNKRVYVRICKENGGLKVYGMKRDGLLAACWFHLSLNATGALGKEYEKRKEAWEERGKKGNHPNTKIYLHQAVAIVSGCPIQDFSTERGGMTIDHKDENPANNVLENLRGMRTELNLARRCDPDGVDRPSYTDGNPRNHYHFAKTFYDYIKPKPKAKAKPKPKRSSKLWKKAKACTELREVGFFDNKSLMDRQIKIRDTKTGVEITDDEARQRAIARKRAQGRAVFAFLKREDPDLFKGWQPERDAAGEWHWVEVDFFDEIFAKWL